MDGRFFDERRTKIIYYFSRSRSRSRSGAGYITAVASTAAQLVDMGEAGDREGVKEAG